MIHMFSASFASSVRFGAFSVEVGARDNASAVCRCFPGAHHGCCSDAASYLISTSSMGKAHGRYGEHGSV